MVLKRYTVGLSKDEVAFLLKEFGSVSRGIRESIRFTREERINWAAVRNKLKTIL